MNKLVLYLLVLTVLDGCLGALFVVDRLAVLDGRLGALLVVHGLAVLLGDAVALLGVLRLALLVRDLVALLVLHRLARLVGHLVALLLVAGAAHLDNHDFEVIRTICRGFSGVHKNLMLVINVHRTSFTAYSGFQIVKFGGHRRKFQS